MKTGTGSKVDGKSRGSFIPWQHPLAPARLKVFAELQTRRGQYEWFEWQKRWKLGGNQGKVNAWKLSVKGWLSCNIKSGPSVITIWVSNNMEYTYVTGKMLLLLSINETWGWYQKLQLDNQTIFTVWNQMLNRVCPYVYIFSLMESWSKKFPYFHINHGITLSNPTVPRD